MSKEQRIIAMIVGVFLFVIIGPLVVMVSQQIRGDDLVTWNVYRGEIPGYNVAIDETIRADGTSKRIVHLYPDTLDVDTFCSGGCAITGHDYEGEFVNDGADWDRVFLCGFPDPTNGCNSLTRRGNRWEWTPASADANILLLERDFRSEMPFAVVALAQAMDAIYNEEYLENRISASHAF